ncbi:hypothetical protein BS50DRAFT_579574 [Corynespora cassiicola Philippines]|uniref:HD/PDEase domain-containing protein n=1 Tax=Corynespora cassiicola Philippines TaxID=1448308 RepID=A0A2T2N3P5_CORCC|nr:hypothetical protein BS50DRAFT_579574 [Corynespora cassiicola Philippines]
MSSKTTLLEATKSYVKNYMSQFDCSHDWSHIQRVHALAHTLLASESSSHPETRYDELVVTLGALLHDVGDKKYILAGQDPTTVVHDFLISAGAQPELAVKVQELVLHVSFSTEKKDPQKVLDVMGRIPELAIVQDADRLDAIGAVGVARCFSFTGAKGKGGLKEAIEHFVEKLETLEGMMKTGSGRELARVRTERLKVFRGWWEEEAGVAIDA